MTASMGVVGGADLLRRARALMADYRFVTDPIDALCSTGSEFVAGAEVHLQRLYSALDADVARFDDAVEAFIEMTTDVMRMQDRYYRTGQFDGGPASLGDDLYLDEDLMGRRYLLGLYLAQVFWPNHVEKVAYFEAVVLPLVADGMRVLEVGTGPGTYGLAIGRAAACSELMLTDISPLSIDLVRRFAAVDPVKGADTLHYSTSDFLGSGGSDVEPFELILFSEIVEHLRDPDEGLDRLAALLAPGASVFFSTATNAAFYDHTVVFETVSEIEDLLRRHRFEITSSRQILALPGPDGRDVVDYVAVLTPETAE